MKILLLFAGMVSFTVIANLLLKTGAAFAEPGHVPLSHLLNWRVMLGLASFALAACFYILILQWLPLNVAVSFAAIQYVAVVVAAALVLSERIAFNQWIGISLIAVGIAIVGWGQR